MPLTAVCILIIMAVSCASAEKKGAGDTGRKNIKDAIREDNGTSGNTMTRSGQVPVEKFSEYLVSEKSYTTNGAYYHKKYEKSLLGLAHELLEDLDMDIASGSIGFYYDKKSSRTDRLYWGVDINVEGKGDRDYGGFAVKQIKDNAGGIVDAMNRHRDILEENEITGIVIGFRWSDGNGGQQVNIWIKKGDISLFHEGQITLNEMYQRSVITNTSGKIILLPI